MIETRQGPPIQFRDQDITAELDARGDNRNLVAKRDLDRYYDLINRLERRLRCTDQEWDAIERVLSTVAFMDTAAPYLVADDIADDIESLTALLGAGAAPLVERLRALHPAEKLALTDLVERRRRREG